MKTVREKWLRCFWVYVGIVTICQVIVIYNSEGNEKQSEIESLFALAIPVWITYHCAYKKRGTALLMCILVSLPILFIVISLGTLLEEPFKQLEREDAIISWSVDMFKVILKSWFWSRCYLYRKENMELGKPPCTPLPPQ